MIYYQNSPEIEDPKARKYGCYVRSPLRVAEIFTGRNFNAAELNKLFNRVLSLGYAHGDYIVDDPAAIVREGFKFRGQDRECYQTARRDLKGIHWWGFAEKDKGYQRIAFMVLKGQTVNHHSHFRLGDNMGIEIFDPYYPKPLIQYEIYQTFYWLGEER